MYEALVEGAQDFICIFDNVGNIEYTNSSVTTLLGWRPEELVGTNIVDFVHPEDLERALDGIATATQMGAPAGSAMFRVRNNAGTYEQVDLSVSEIDPGHGRRIAVFCRSADYQHATNSVLQLLLQGESSIAETLTPVLDAFAWRSNDARVAIAWYESETGHRFVSTGLPGELTGGEEEPGKPWARCRATGQPVHERMPVSLDPHRAALAEELDRGHLWVEPVPDTATGVTALITVWGSSAGRPPEGHANGMTIAVRFVELILRWRQQLGLLEDAAYRDSLTGLSNRKVFFDLLKDERPVGALLYCDLDHFKPVNDAFGHAAGDDLLRQAADRLQACVRADDVLARLGGDEFVILCRGATAEDAHQLAGRITASFAVPFLLADSTVEVGISIGVAQSDDALTEVLLDEADRSLYQHKARRRDD
jgi:diguanylate cyclase (GGDEF)-like protein/PAS domain S-box-containing protein